MTVRMAHKRYILTILGMINQPQLQEHQGAQQRVAEGVPIVATHAYLQRGLALDRLLYKRLELPEDAHLKFRMKTYVAPQGYQRSELQLLAIACQ